MKRIVLAIFIVVAGFFLIGCPNSTINPLGSDEDTSEPEEVIPESDGAGDISFAFSVGSSSALSISPRVSGYPDEVIWCDITEAYPTLYRQALSTDPAIPNMVTVAPGQTHLN